MAIAWNATRAKARATNQDTGPAAVKLQVQNVSKSFAGRNGRVEALDGISLHVAEGECLCLVGPSGCGKSTLLNLIAGLEKPDKGAVFANGELVEWPGPERSVIFQEAALFPWLNVVSNVEFGLRIAGVPAAERRERAMRYLEMVHLTRFANAWVHELSGGMKQRVALARALVLKPDILLMDEPFAALDAQARDALHGELQQLWQASKTTIVFVTHNVREAVCLGDRVIVLSAGPGHIKREFRVDLPRPREIEDEGVISLARDVRDELRDEIAKVLEEEMDAR
jgi:NitT/TauT family transport system ATP-binding protein